VCHVIVLVAHHGSFMISVKNFCDVSMLKMEIAPKSEHGGNDCTFVPADI
jgi:hypothetical protein